MGERGPETEYRRAYWIRTNLGCVDRAIIRWLALGKLRVALGDNGWPIFSVDDVKQCIDEDRRRLLPAPRRLPTPAPVGARGRTIDAEDPGQTCSPAIVARRSGPDAAASGSRHRHAATRSRSGALRGGRNLE